MPGVKKDVLFSATEEGLCSLKESSEEQRKLRDTINTDTCTINRILSANERKEAEELHWHKSCYAKYTDKGKISRLRKFLDTTNAKPEVSASTALHSKTSIADWELCVFCQDWETSRKQKLCSVKPFKMSQQILEGAKCDHDLSLRVAGVNDLIAAAEGKIISSKLL